MGSPLAYQSIGEDITERVRADEQLKRRLEFEKTISQISSRFVKVSDIDEAINTSFAEVSRVSGASRVYLFLFNKDLTTMDNTHEWCANGVSPQIDRLKNITSAMFLWWMKKLKKKERLSTSRMSRNYLQQQRLKKAYCKAKE